MPPQFDDDDDELLEGMDDDEGAPADPEFEQKYAEFMREVDKHIRVVMKPKEHKPAQRLESVRMLGELGEIKAIKSLVTVYQKDRTPGMKEAAAKSLALLKALQQAIEDDDPDIQAYVTKLMDGIVRRREIGKSSRIKPRQLRMLVGGLTVSMIILFALGFLLGGDGGTVTADVTPTVTETPTVNPLAVSSPIEVARALSAFYVDLSSDIHMLQMQLTGIEGGYLPDCAAEFKNPALVTVPENLASNEGLNSAAGTLADAHEQVVAIQGEFVSACGDNSMSADAAEGFLGDLETVQSSLSSISTQLSAIGIVMPPTPTPMTPTPAPTLMPTPTITPTPVAPQLINTQRLGLEQLINTMTSTRGYNSLLLVYWTDVVTTGSTAGCLNLPPPTLPDDYELPGTLAQTVPELGRAMSNVNTGLELSRASWGAFEAGCAADNLVDMAVQQQQFAQTAQAAFREAGTILEGLDN